MDKGYQRGLVSLVNHMAVDTPYAFWSYLRNPKCISSVHGLFDTPFLLAAVLYAHVCRPF